MSVKAGNIFLMGQMRHASDPIYPDNNDVTSPSQGKDTTYYGSLNISTAQAIQADFPWAEFDTTDVYTGRLDLGGKLTIGDYGAENQAIRTQYARDRNRGVGYYDGSTYTYLYKSGSLVWFNGVMTQDSADEIGHGCADDILDIMSGRSDTSWTDPNTDIRYKLKLWGFVNSGNSQECRPDLEKVETSKLEECFITRERTVPYDYLYSSIEQKRPMTFAKDIKADSLIQGSLTIPIFDCVNVSPGETFDAENWETPKSLAPTWNVEDINPKDYTLLTPGDTAMVQEAGTTPQAAVSRSADDVWITGWFLRDISCTVGKGGAPPLHRDGAIRLDKSDSMNLNQRTVRLDET